MANGYPPDSPEAEVLRSAFAPIGPQIEQFALAHGLALVKYDHSGPAWRLEFRTVTLEQAAVEICYDFEKECFVVTATCWVDDYDSGKRSMRQSAVGTLSKGQDPSNILDDGLKAVLSWCRSDLIQDEETCDWKDQMTKAAFDEFSERAPILRQQGQGTPSDDTR